MPAKPTTILGIDPGYGRCGFAVVRQEAGDLVCVTHGVITTSPDQTFPKRLLEIQQDIEAVISAHQPDIIGLEELFFSKNVTTGLKVAQVRGVISALSAARDIALIEVKPVEVKMALTGFGGADKRQMQEMVKVVFGLREIPKPDDAADALAIAYACAGATWQAS